jgi:hypothetical protein
MVLAALPLTLPNSCSHFHKPDKRWIKTTLLWAYRNSVCYTDITHEHGKWNTRKNAQVVTSLQTSCYTSVHKLSTSCARTACSQFVVTSLKQAVNNL